MADQNTDGTQFDRFTGDQAEAEAILAFNKQVGMRKPTTEQLGFLKDMGYTYEPGEAEPFPAPKDGDAKEDVKTKEQTHDASESFPLKENFTGEVTASNGAVYHYVDGVRVAAADHDAHVATHGKSSPTVANPNPVHFSNLVHMVGEHYAKGDVSWKVAGKALDKLLKKYGGTQEHWNALAKELGYDAEGKKSTSGLLSHLKSQFESGGFSQNKADAAKQMGPLTADEEKADKPATAPADEKPNAAPDELPSAPTADGPLPTPDELKDELGQVAAMIDAGDMTAEKAADHLQALAHDMTAQGLDAAKEFETVGVKVPTKAAEPAAEPPKSSEPVTQTMPAPPPMPAPTSPIPTFPSGVTTHVKTAKGKSWNDPVFEESKSHIKNNMVGAKWDAIEQVWYKPGHHGHVIDPAKVGGISYSGPQIDAAVKWLKSEAGKHGDGAGHYLADVAAAYPGGVDVMAAHAPSIAAKAGFPGKKLIDILKKDEPFGWVELAPEHTPSSGGAKAAIPHDELIAAGLKGMKGALTDTPQYGYTFGGELNKLHDALLDAGVPGDKLPTAHEALQYLGYHDLQHFQAATIANGGKIPKTAPPVGTTTKVPPPSSQPAASQDATDATAPEMEPAAQHVHDEIVKHAAAGTLTPAKLADLHDELDSKELASVHAALGVDGKLPHGEKHAQIVAKHGPQKPTAPPHPHAEHVAALKQLAHIFKNANSKKDLYQQMLGSGLNTTEISTAWKAAGLLDDMSAPYYYKFAQGNKGWTAAQAKQLIPKIEAKIAEFSGGFNPPASPQPTASVTVGSPVTVNHAANGLAPVATYPKAGSFKAKQAQQLGHYGEHLAAAQKDAAAKDALFSVDTAAAKSYAGKQGADVDPTWQPQTNPAKAAYGGIVLKHDADGKPMVLLRKPTNHFDGYHWTFPKGKQDKHPDAATAALAEVAEETGHKGEIIGHLPGTFKSGSGATTNYFVMKSTGEDKSLMDWETSETAWVPLDKAHEYLGQTTNAAGKARDLATLDAVKKQWGDLTATEESEPEKVPEVEFGTPEGHKPAGIDKAHTKDESLHAAKTADVIPGWDGMKSVPESKQKYATLFVRNDPTTGAPQVFMPNANGGILGTVGKTPAEAALASTGGTGHLIGHLPTLLESGGESKYGVFIGKLEPGQMLNGGQWVALADAEKHATGSATAQQRWKDAVAGAKKYAVGGGADAKIDDAVSAVQTTVEQLADAPAAEITGTLKQQLSGLHPHAVDAVAAKLGTTAKGLAQWAVDKAHGNKTVNGFPKGLNSFKSVVSIGQGSTGAKKATDDAGNVFSHKKGGGAKYGQEQLHNEHAAGKVFSILGLDVPKSKLYTDADGKTVKLSQWVDGKDLGDYMKTATPAEKSALKSKIQKSFVAHALLGNWDVFGQSQDNIKVDKDGNPHYIDNGSVFDISATATKKGAGEGKPFAPDSVPELDSMRSDKYSKYGKEWFGDIPQDEIHKQIAQVYANKSRIVKALKDVPHHAKAVADRIEFLHDWAVKGGNANAVTMHADNGDKVHISPQIDPSKLNTTYSHGKQVIKGSNNGTGELLHYLNDITDEERQAVYNYSSNSYYSALNKAMYKNDKLTKKQQEIDAGIQAAFSKQPELHEAITLHRGVSFSGNPQDIPKFLDFLQRKQKNGGVIQWRNYQSCCTDPAKAWSAGSSGFKFTIKNVKYGAMDIKPIAWSPGEEEVLLNRHVKLKVLDIIPKGNKWEVVMEQVPHDDTEPVSEQTNG